MRRIAATALTALLACAAWAAPVTSTVSFVINAPNGSPVTAGTITAELSQPGTTADGATVVMVATKVSAAITSAGFSLALVPNDRITPPGTFYKMSIQITAPVFASQPEKWQVPYSATPLNASGIVRLNLAPAVSAGPFAYYVATDPTGACLATDPGRISIATKHNCVCPPSTLVWDCTSASGTPGHTIAEETTPLAARSFLRFLGANVTCIDNSGANATECTFDFSGIGVTDADKGDIIVSGSGTNWQLDPDSVGAPELSPTAIQAGDIESGDLPGTIASNTSGNAGTATALAANGANCAGGNFARGVDASGVAECQQPAFSNLSGAASDDQIPNTISIDFATEAGHASSADTALTANSASSAGNAAQLTNDPSPCAGGLYTIDTNVFGAVQCAQVQFSQVGGTLTDAQVPNSITVDLAAVAAALQNNPAACPAGQYGVDTDTTAALACAQVQFSQVGGTVATGQTAAGITLDTEWDALVELEAAYSANLLVATEIDTSDELAALLGAGDFTGTAAFVRAQSPSIDNPVFTTKYNPPSGTSFPTSGLAVGDRFTLLNDTAVGACIPGGAARTDCRWNGSVWQSIGAVTGAGDVVGPAGATDNAVARMDGNTGKLIQNSLVTIDDSGNTSTPGSVSTGCTPSSGDCGMDYQINTAEPGAPISGRCKLYAQGTNWQIKCSADGTTARVVLDSGNLTGDFTCNPETASCAAVAGITRDAEIDSCSEINALTGDDDFVTLLGVQTIQSKIVAGGDAGAGSTQPASGNVMTLLVHNTDCTNITTGKKGQQCADADDGRTWVCLPASGDCDQPSEWKRVDSTGGSGLSQLIVPANYASPTSSLDKVLLRTTQAISIDSVHAALTGTTSVTWDLVYARAANEATTLGQVFGSDTVTSSASGVSVSPGSPVIPTDAWLRVKASAASGTPSNLYVQVAYQAATSAQCNDGIDNDSGNGIDYPADAGCASATDTSESSGDSTAPEAISDLGASNATSTSCDLAWTAPHEDGASGGAVATYDCRVCAQATCSTTMDNTEFASATQLTGEPGTPGSPGAAQSFTATGLGSSTAYVFACKSNDEVPNASAVSNSATCTTSASAAASVLGWGSWEKDQTCSAYTTSTTAPNQDYPNGTNCALTTCQSGDPGIIVETAAAKVGTYGLHAQGVGGGVWEVAECNNTALFSPTIGCANTQVLRVASGSENFFRSQGGTGRFSCGWVGNEVDCIYTDGTNTLEVISTGGATPTGVWRNIDFCWDATAGTPIARLRIYDDSGQIGSDFTDTTATPGAMTTAATGWQYLTMGDASGTATVDLYFDTWATCDTYNCNLQNYRNNTASPR